MIIVAIISILIYTYSIYCLLRELVQINKSLLEESRSKVHVSILMYGLITNLSFVYWVFDHEGAAYGLYTHIIDENMWLFLIMSAQFTTSITRHFRKQRLNEDILVSYSNEFKRTMSFAFKKDNEFDIVVKQFITEMNRKGLEVEHIKESLENIDQYKELKDGEIIAFSKSTRLEKVGDAVVHNYIFHNDKPLIFYFHEHLLFEETIACLDNPIVLYLKIEDNLKTIPLGLNDNYTIPKGIMHAVIFSEANRINLKWS